MGQYSEVFPNPTVKKVVFQIRFPNLFFIESKIGDIQIAIMKEFPDSSALLRKQIVFADLGPDIKLDNMQSELVDQPTKKIWQFKSPKNYQLNILNDSLDISSAFHKTYNNPESDNRFRDIIEFVLINFFKITNVPLISRIGLRYIDECPIAKKSNRSFRMYYNSTFPLNRYNIDDAYNMEFSTTHKRDDFYLRYKESLQKNDDKDVLLLDFDCYKTDIEPSSCLEITDKLHDIITEEYFKTIKEPVINYMRNRGSKK